MNKSSIFAIYMNSMLKRLAANIKQVLAILALYAKRVLVLLAVRGNLEATTRIQAVGGNHSSASGPMGSPPHDNKAVST